jgi:hypothetical protein
MTVVLREELISRSLTTGWSSRCGDLSFDRNIAPADRVRFAAQWTYARFSFKMKGCKMRSLGFR